MPIGYANRTCTRVRRYRFSFLLFCAVDRQTTTIMRIECMPILVVYAHSSDNKLGVHKDIKTQEIS